MILYYILSGCLCCTTSVNIVTTIIIIMYICAGSHCNKYQSLLTEDLRKLLLTCNTVQQHGSTKNVHMFFKVTYKLISRYMSFTLGLFMVTNQMEDRITNKYHIKFSDKHCLHTLVRHALHSKLLRYHSLQQGLLFLC